jgi:hypothetical protein
MQVEIREREARYFISVLGFGLRKLFNDQESDTEGNRRCRNIGELKLEFSCALVIASRAQYIVHLTKGPPWRVNVVYNHGGSPCVSPHRPLIDTMMSVPWKGLTKFVYNSVPVMAIGRNRMMTLQ